MTDDRCRPDIEDWLTERHVEFTYEPTFDLAKVDRKASHANQARDEAVTGDTVEKYSSDMAAGDEFPPIVVRRRPRSPKVVVIDGNHRVASCDRTKTKRHPAYVIDCEPEMAQRLTFEANRRHGLPPSTAERIGHAIALIASGNYTQAEASRIAGVTQPQVSKAQGIARASDRARRLDCPRSFDLLPAEARYQLGKVRSDPVFVEAVKLTLDASLTVGDTKQLCSKVDRASSDQDALTLIGTEQEALREQIQSKGGGHRQRTTTSARVKALRACTDVLLLDPVDVAQAVANDDQRRELRQRLKAAAKHLMDVDKKIAR